MKLEEIKLWVQIISTIATTIGVISSLYFSTSKTKARYGFFCKLINQKNKIIVGKENFTKIAFGFISGNEFDIGIQQSGVEFKSTPFKKAFYRDFEEYDENSGEKSKAREIYYKTVTPFFGVKEFNERWDKKVYIRPYVIDMSGRIVKMNWFKMIKHRFKVKDFAYKGIPDGFLETL